jgi:hypothetical protein
MNADNLIIGLYLFLEDLDGLLVSSHGGRRV